MSDFSFIDRDGDEITAIPPGGYSALIEVNINGGGQYISFYAADASAVIRIIQQAAGLVA